jgi:3-deoxy-manno-octulosonate cytidylyltransferase (CMP-KDO synthetase)
VAEVAQGIEADVYINLQCDEPALPPTTIDRVCGCFDGDPGVQVATACVPIPDPEDALDPHVVKVVTNSEGRALYFSRAPIPFAREGQAPFFKHLGIYGYRRRLLLNLARLRPSPLEEIEKLEQLRFLENRIPIQVATVDEDSIGVDTQEDLERVRPFFENGSLIPSQRPTNIAAEGES